MKKAPALITIVFLAAISWGCGIRMGRLERSNDYEELFNGAMAFYEKGKYSKAKILFERIHGFYRGSEYSEKIRYYWAYCEYYMGLYQLATYQFGTFYKTYGRSPLAEEAQFMEAYSLYLDSPDADLEQSNSEEAVIAMQDFLNRYPASQYYDQANKIVDELQIKFETKAYQTAKLYYRLSTGLSFRNYLEAALTTFQSFQSDYPDSQYNEELMFLCVETSFKIADNSIISLRKERFDRTINFYNSFVSSYPESKYTEQIQKYYNRSIKALDKLKIN